MSDRIDHKRMQLEVARRERMLITEETIFWIEDYGLFKAQDIKGMYDGYSTLAWAICTERRITAIHKRDTYTQLAWATSTSQDYNEFCENMKPNMWWYSGRAPHMEELPAPSVIPVPINIDLPFEELEALMLKISKSWSRK